MLCELLCDPTTTGCGSHGPASLAATPARRSGPQRPVERRGVPGGASSSVQPRGQPWPGQAPCGAQGPLSLSPTNPHTSSLGSAPPSKLWFQQARRGCGPAGTFALSGFSQWAPWLGPYLCCAGLTAPVRTAGVAAHNTIIRAPGDSGSTLESWTRSQQGLGDCNEEN